MLESLSTKPTNFAGLTKMPAELFTHFYYNNVHLYWPTAKTKEVDQSRTQSLQAFWSAGQRREDSGDIEFYYRRISAVKQWKPLRNSQSKKLNFFDVPRVFPALPR